MPQILAIAIKDLNAGGLIDDVKLVLIVNGHGSWLEESPIRYSMQTPGRFQAAFTVGSERSAAGEPHQREQAAAAAQHDDQRHDCASTLRWRRKCVQEMPLASVPGRLRFEFDVTLF